MSTAALEFTLLMNTSSIQQGMVRVKQDVATGLRGMAQAAREESHRIQSALASITAFRELKQGVIDSRAEWQKAQAEATRLGAALNQVGPPIKGLKQEFERAKQAAIEAQATFLKQTRALDTLRASMSAAGLATTGLGAAQAGLRAELAANEARFRTQARSMQRLQEARDRIGIGPRINTDREVLRLQAAYERLRASGTLTASELARAHLSMTERIVALRNGTDGWSDRLALVREQLIKLAVAGAGIGLAAKEAIQFEAAMADVRKVVDFATPQAFTEMTTGIKAMSREIPVSLVGLAKIAESGGQMGIAAKEIQGFTEVVARMATAFKINPDEAGTAVGRLMNVFALTVPQTRLLADAINHLGNNTNAVEKDIVEVMNRTGGMARVFGLANTETAALAATFLSMGLGPERASTAINALTRELMNAPQQTDKFKNALQRIGLTSEELASRIQKGPQQAIMDLLGALSGLDRQTKMETLVGLFGDLYSDEIVQVVNNLGKYQEILGLVGKESNFAGSMQKEFTERIKTTEAQLQLAKNAISEAAVNLGNAFLPAIVTAARAIASLMHHLAELAETFPRMSAAAVTALTALAGFGALRLVWSALRAGVVSMIAPLGSLAVAARSLAFTPLGAVLTAVSVAAWAFSKATASNVAPLLENASALGKGREATVDKIKALEALRTTLAATQPGTREHTEAEEKLAAILPGATLALNEQGRVLARVGDETDENAVRLASYLELLQQENRQTLALQLDLQARAFGEAKKEMVSYVEGLKNWYGIGTGEALTSTQRFWLWMGKLTGAYDDNIAKGAEHRRQLSETESGMKTLLTEARRAGLSVAELGQALDAVHADPAVRTQVVAMFRAMHQEVEAATMKTASLAETFKRFSIALSGPVAAAKKGMVDAIGVTDKQLGKYNEALSQHREKLKQAVDDETKSWKSLAQASTSAFKGTTEKIEAEYDQRRQKLTSTLEAGLISERRLAQASTAILIQENDAKLAETRRYM
ncbi:MAG: phage tail tape measure protein, partial [Magnetococcales bacterium]|nr:phage tail tape measure protein [Magnetococcales bacterium]